MTTAAFAHLGSNRGGLLLSAAAAGAAPPLLAEAPPLEALQQPGRMTQCAPRPAEELPDWLPAVAAAAGAGEWAQFSCRFEDGSRDRIALHLQGGCHDAHCAEILAALWPVAREDALRELAGAANEAVTQALLWTLAKKTDAAVLVLDAGGHLLQCNESGRECLAGGSLLQESGGQLRCANAEETKAFYAALRQCAREPDRPAARRGGKTGGARELILFLEDRAHGMRLPVSLTRCPGAALVVAILPRQPDRRRIEMLARKMGLSPAEARVAALIQLGLSNREAAHIAGLKEQTFNTYAKRVLSKLDAAGRAEMAQRLTWQASLGRGS
ncbi:helix-turn-helix transcriptional regulator (plasmid) [Roseobacteraceae bacterium NS-SX3]